MPRNVAIIGAGVSGLTCGVVLAEQGDRVTILARETGQGTTSAVAAAIWFPYDAEPADRVIPWALQTFTDLRALSERSGTGVSMIEQRIFSRQPGIKIPKWARQLGPKSLGASGNKLFASGFSLFVPLTDTTIYLEYLADRFRAAGGEIKSGVTCESLEELDYDLIVNCTGVGARALAHDPDVEPHRGQVALVPRMDLPYALVCDDAPLTYVIPRSQDCVFGGTNTISDNLVPDPATTDEIMAECSRTLNIEKPQLLAERVGLRPFRKSGVRLERARLPDGRGVIHNYGHGGSGFTLSWGCAREVAVLAR